MTRFSKLEFGDGFEKNKDRSDISGEEIRNDEYFQKQAIRFWLAGDFELALRNFSRSLEQNSAFYPGWLGQVQMLIELREYKEAAVWVDKALEMFPEHPELLAIKAVALARDGLTEKAVAYSDDTITKENLTPLVWLARAEVLMHRKSSIAQTCISKAISLAGQGEEGLLIHLMAGRILNANGEYVSALQYLRMVTDEIPKSALAWYELGYAQAGLAKPEAKICFEQALKFHPKWLLAEEAIRKTDKKGFFSRLFGR